MTVSARTPSALDTATQNLANYLRENPGSNLADVAFTLKAGRHDFGLRRMLVCRSAEEAVAALETTDPQQVFGNDRVIGERPVAFLFPGQGAQYVDMGRELYATEPVFRAAVDTCAELLTPQLKLDLRSVLFPLPVEAESAAQQLAQTAITQPALFVIAYALAQLWLSWGVQPQALIGHSIGEYVTATLAGVFTLEDALALVAARGRLMQALLAGAMLSLSLPEAEVRPLLNGSLSLAASNSPTVTVVSGTLEAIAALEQQLTANEISSRRLHTSHAFHSAMLDPILAQFTADVGRVQRNAPSIPFISNVSGTWITDEQATDPRYWAQHLRQPVRFAEGLRALMTAGEHVLLEVGPGRTLSTLARQTLGADSGVVVLHSLRHPQDQQSDVAFILTTLGKLWLAGLTFDWRGFYAHERRHRIPLPTYPFERQSYWMQSDLSALLSMGAQQAALEKQPDLADWCYLPSWKQTRQPEPFAAEQLATTTQNWLVFGDGSGLSTSLVQRLRDANQVVIAVQPGDAFHQTDAGTYALRPEQAADYTQLLTTLRAGELVPQRIVHLWTLTPDDAATHGSDRFERMQQLGFASLIALTQALGADELESPVDLIVVSNGLHDVTGGEALHPEKATLLGPCRVIPREYLQISCRSLDVVLPHTAPRLVETLVDQILAEAQHATTDPIIAYRGARRWAQTLEPAPLPAVTGRPARVRDQGVYLITGGLGGIGLALATHLAQTAQARLVLVGRSAFPERAAWAGLLDTLPEADATAQKIRQLQNLEALGAEVLVLRADVTDAAQLRAVVAQATARFGAIHGVIHAAGVAGGGVIQLKTPEVMDRVLAPKTHGLLALQAATRDQPLDFLLLCSSLTAIVGELGQAEYAAANAFLDAFAHAQAARGGPFTVSVNWDSWREVGMAVTTEVPPEMRALHEQMLQSGILPGEGVEIFDRVLAQRTAPQVIISTRDLPLRIRTLHAMTRNMLVEAQEQARAIATRAGHARPALATAYVAPRTPFEENVAAVWQQVLGLEQVGVHDSFFDLGGHSLLITQLTNKLHRVYDVELSIRTLFDSPTVAGMAQVIAQAYEEKAANAEQPIQELVRSTTGTERQSLLEAYWKQNMATVLNLAADQLPATGDLSGYDLNAVINDVQWHFEQDFGLLIYPHETVKLRSIEQMARLTASELDRLANLKHNTITAPISHYAAYEERSLLEARVKRPLLTKPARKNAPIFFSHSCVRSGSTLFRLMLAGHPALHAPPELGILWYDTMREWRRSLTDPTYGHGFHWAAQGVQWTFMELLGCDTETAKAYMDDLVANDTPIYEVYARLQELSAPRILVDKSPSYTMSLDTLQRGEVIFDRPKYIHLVRHPYAVIESMVRIRLDKLFSPVLYGSDDVDPFVTSEKVWVTSNRNLLTFLQAVDDERQLRVYYEQLVSQPEETMRRVCDFLELPYDPAVMQPYDNKRERMISGIGDPNILKHDTVDAHYSETWRTVKLPWRLGAPVQQLAAELGYELPAESEANGEQNLVELVGAEQLTQLMASVQQLSPEEVQAMLAAKVQGMRAHETNRPG